MFNVLGVLQHNSIYIFHCTKSLHNLKCTLNKVFPSYNRKIPTKCIEKLTQNKPKSSSRILQHENQQQWGKKGNRNFSHSLHYKCALFFLPHIFYVAFHVLKKTTNHIFKLILRTEVGINQECVCLPLLAAGYLLTPMNASIKTF